MSKKEEEDVSAGWVADLAGAAAVAGGGSATATGEPPVSKLVVVVYGTTEQITPLAVLAAALRDRGGFQGVKPPHRDVIGACTATVARDSRVGVSLAVLFVTHGCHARVARAHGFKPQFSLRGDPEALLASDEFRVAVEADAGSGNAVRRAPCCLRGVLWRT